MLGHTTKQEPATKMGDHKQRLQFPSSEVDGLDELRASLTADERTLLYLSIERGLSFRDVAVVLGRAPIDDEAALDQAAAALKRQLMGLRERIRKRGLELGLLGSRADEITTPRC